MTDAGLRAMTTVCPDRPTRPTRRQVRGRSPAYASAAPPRPGCICRPRLRTYPYLSVPAPCPAEFAVGRQRMRQRRNGGVSRTKKRKKNEKYLKRRFNNSRKHIIFSHRMFFRFDIVCRSGGGSRSFPGVWLFRRVGRSRPARDRLQVGRR